MATPAHLQKAPQRFDEFTIDDEPAAALVHKPAAPRRAPPRRTAEDVLIPRENIDDALPYAKMVASGLGWINSVVTTVLTAAGLQVFITGRPATWIAWVGGFVVAGILTFGQIFCAKRTRIGYAICLFPDALMTSYQWCSWLLLPLFAKLLPSWTLAALIAAVLGGILGIVSARLPERLTFGK